MPKSDADILFSISSAHITLETSLGLKASGKCAITFKTVSGSLFYEMESDLRRFLDTLRPEFDLGYRSVTDKYGYMWIILEGRRIEDLLAGLTAVAGMVEEKGFSDQLLAAVFEFQSEREENDHQYLIYNFKRNNFYPFVPLQAQKSRDTEKELKIMSAIGREAPFERDVTLWYPLWDLPLRTRG
jgi:hypothetical protein